MNAAELETKTREIANLALAIAGQLAGVRSVTADGITYSLPTLERSGAVSGALSLESAIRAWRAMARTAPQSARDALERIKVEATSRGFDTPVMIQDDPASEEKDDGTSAAEIFVSVVGFLGGLLDAVTGKKDTGGGGGGNTPPASKPPASDNNPSGLAAVPTWALALGGLLLVLVLTGRVPAAR